MTWRKDRLPPLEEFTALSLERSDQWARTQLGFQAGNRVQVPAEIRIARPGDKPPERNVVTDPREIAAALRNLIG